MTDIHIERRHHFGLARARALARQWADEAEKKFEMECSIGEGDAADTVQFKRSGVAGTVRVEADRFTLDATLGFLLGAFSKTITAEIEKNLDALLASAPPAAAVKLPAKKPTPRRDRK
jgi:putative polyhydroxyalkanoate system protein